MTTKVPIIYYHEIVRDGEGQSYQRLDVSKFKEQMQYLHESGYHSLLFSELGNPLPWRPVVVSFDDGFQSVTRHAVPIMRELGIRGNVYLPTGYVGKDKFMSWLTVRKLYSSKEWYFAAHTHNHVDIRTLSRERMDEEIRTSNELIADQLGYVPEAFCIPYGTYDWRSAKLIRGVGSYTYILGSTYGHAKPSKAARRVLPRIGISNDDSLRVFQNKLCGKLNWKGPLQKSRLAIQNMRGERVVQYDY